MGATLEDDDNSLRTYGLLKKKEGKKHPEKKKIAPSHGPVYIINPVGDYLPLGGLRFPVKHGISSLAKPEKQSKQILWCQGVRGLF